MKARVKWVEDLRFIGQPTSGHGVVMDASAGAEGKVSGGSSPMEMILMGLGGCAGIDVVMILKKSREAVTDCVVDLEATRAETIPKVFTDIHMVFTVTGTGLTEAKVENAVRLSHEKYCSASLMLGKSVNITRETRIVEAG
ncbi:MAG: OsmC family protein [Rhodospirillales bacterium]|jgi:putative redox protein|nr:OsmC family protein [Rhodospirillales bacterium]